MPIYEYKCEKCNKVTEELQKFSDAPLTLCKECNTDTLVKQLSTGTGFCLMGHGWDRPGMSVGKQR